MGTPDYMAPEQARGRPHRRHPRRHLQPGLHPLLPADGPAAVPGADGAAQDPRPPRAAGAGSAGPPARRAGRPGAGRREDAGQEAGGPLPDARRGRGGAGAVRCRPAIRPPPRLAPGCRGRGLLGLLVAGVVVYRIQTDRANWSSRPRMTTWRSSSNRGASLSISWMPRPKRKSRVLRRLRVGVERRDRRIEARHRQGDADARRNGAWRIERLPIACAASFAVQG